MALPKIPNLTDRDIEILLACVEPKSKQDISTKTGIPYSYCEKRITRLRNTGFLSSLKINKVPVYRTTRIPDTENLWLFAESSEGKKLVHQILFKGQMNTFSEAFGRVIALGRTLPGERQSFTDTIFCALAILKNKSYRKSQGQSNSQFPSLEEMRDILFQYIKVVEWELDLAREIYKKDFLWVDSESICNIISEGPPSKRTLEAYENANKWFKRTTTQRKEQVVKKLAEPQGLTPEQQQAYVEYSEQWKAEGWE